MSRLLEVTPGNIAIYTVAISLAAILAIGLAWSHRLLSEMTCGEGRGIPLRNRIVLVLATFLLIAAPSGCIRSCALDTDPAFTSPEPSP